MGLKNTTNSSTHKQFGSTNKSHIISSEPGCHMSSSEFPQKKDMARLIPFLSYSLKPLHNLWKNPQKIGGQKPARNKTSNLIPLFCFSHSSSTSRLKFDTNALILLLLSIVPIWTMQWRSEKNQLPLKKKPPHQNQGTVQQYLFPEQNQGCPPYTK